MKKYNKIVICLLLLFPILLSGQIKIHKTITTSDGLVNGQVRDIYEDSKGFYWFATNGGVSKWDGNTFTNFTEANGLTSSYVFDITEGSDSTIYFANFGVNGITTYKNGILDTLFNEGNEKVTFLTLIYYTKDSSLLMGAADGLILYKNNVQLNLNTLYDIPSASMHQLVENSKGEIFVCTEDGILKITDRKLEVVFGYDGTKNNYVQALGINKNDLLYFTVEDKFLILENNKISEVNPKLNYLGNRIDDIQFSKNNIGYFATEIGLGVLEPNGKFSLLTKDNGLSNNKQYKIFLSNDEYVYTASSISDVNLFKPGMLENYNIEFGLPDNHIFNIYVDKSGTKYISTGDGLLIENQHFRKIISSKQKVGYNSFISFVEQSNGQVYLGTNSGIDVVNNGKIERFVKFSKSKHMKHNESNDVFSIAKYDDSSFYAGTYRGVYKIVGKKVSLLTIKDGLLNNFVAQIFVTDDKSIIYGYHGNGISIFKKGKFKHYTVDDGLSNNSILSLNQGEDGAILIGTKQGGLNIIRDGKIDTITIDDGLTSNEIRAINKDKFGNIYLSTPNGLNILRFDNELSIRIISQKDGLAGNDCNNNSLFVDDNSNVWIGTSNGLSKYNPYFDTKRSSPPTVFMSGIKIFNKSFPLDKFKLNPELDYDNNYIDFLFSGINIPNSHKLKYKYRLVGVDKDWVSGKETHIQYTSLDDGEYTFEVKAANDWNIWSEPTLLSFTINPAWWETWWFYTLTVLSIGFLIAFVASYRYRNLLAIEKMRSKISADLHDSVGSGLSEISILSELIGAQIPKDKNDLKSGLGNISTISKTLIESMSDIVWLVNPKKDTLKDLFKRLQLSYHEVLKYTDIDLSVENLDDLENIKLPMNFRQHLYLIFKEAINNAIKYSGGDLLSLSISTSGNNLTVTFSDNGKGFDQNEKIMGNGLINMRNRAREIGGNIEYYSKPNAGTKVKFTGKFQKHKSIFI